MPPIGLPSQSSMPAGIPPGPRPDEFRPLPIPSVSVSPRDRPCQPSSSSASKGQFPLCLDSSSHCFLRSGFFASAFAAGAPALALAAFLPHPSRESSVTALRTFIGFAFQAQPHHCGPPSGLFLLSFEPAIGPFAFAFESAFPAGQPEAPPMLMLKPPPSADAPEAPQGPAPGCASFAELLLLFA